jgi:hypothetical protein
MKGGARWQRPQCLVRLEVVVVPGLVGRCTTHNGATVVVQGVVCLAACLQRELIGSIELEEARGGIHDLRRSVESMEHLKLAVQHVDVIRRAVGRRREVSERRMELPFVRVGGAAPGEGLDTCAVLGKHLPRTGRSAHTRSSVCGGSMCVAGAGGVACVAVGGWGRACVKSRMASSLSPRLAHLQHKGEGEGESEGEGRHTHHEPRARELRMHRRACQLGARSSVT